MKIYVDDGINKAKIIEDVTEVLIWSQGDILNYWVDGVEDEIRLSDVTHITD